MKTCNAEQYNGKLWIPEDCTAAFEEQQIPLTACYTALSCKECGVHKIRIFKVSLLCCVNRLPKCNMKLCTTTAHVHFCSHFAEDVFKRKMQHTMCVSMQDSTPCTQFYMRWLLLEVFFFTILGDRGSERTGVIIVYPFCTLFCYLLFAAAGNAFQRPDKNCQWFCSFTDNSSVFVQGDFTHQGALLCLCCKALKRRYLCCKALKGEPLNPCKYS